MSSIHKKQESKEQMALCYGTKGSVYVSVTKEQEGKTCQQQIIQEETLGGREINIHRVRNILCKLDEPVGWHKSVNLDPQKAL